MMDRAIVHKIGLKSSNVTKMKGKKSSLNNHVYSIIISFKEALVIVETHQLCIFVYIWVANSPTISFYVDDTLPR